MSSLKQKAIKGTIWTVAGYGGSQFLRLVANLILTRLLVPELFGLMALANTFITGLALFSDVGIQPSIVRSPRGEEAEFLNTAWTIQVIRGCVLWIGCLVIAFPVSRFYEEPKLLWLIPIIGFNSCFLAGFKSTSLATLSRNFRCSQANTNPNDNPSHYPHGDDYLGIFSTNYLGFSYRQCRFRSQLVNLYWKFSNLIYSPSSNLG